MIEYRDDGNFYTTSGDKIPTFVTADGVPAIRLNRLVWAWHKDEIEKRIVTVDGDRSNTRIENLTTEGRVVDIVYREDGTLWSSDGARRLFATEGPGGYLFGYHRGVRRHASHVVWEIHHGRAHEGKLVFIDGDRSNTRIENLAEHGGRCVISHVRPVDPDPLWDIFLRATTGGVVSSAEREALRVPHPQHVRDEALRLFREHREFVKMGSAVASRDLTVKIRRVIVERMVVDGLVRYDRGHDLYRHIE